ncbi:MAG TPA: oligopeptide/dipeptide ABC transporter ATP-binding protein [Gaiellales bacterium]|nr:oligopeptide/dipeptide ABC transporter ATP-binding protein [Gaiellales bacterium]
MSTTAEPGPLLEVDDLVTRYPVSRGVVGTLKRQPRLQVHAVEGVSFSVGPGEMVALVGESGCGKTSTAQTVIRMVDNQGGSIRFDGRDITGMSAGGMRPLRREIQMIYQDPYESLDPRFRVRDTIEEPLLVHKLGGSSKEREQKVLEALKRAGLTPPDLFIDRFPHELSGGQRQRVAIAASLVLDPKLLVADEPVSMLDVSVRAGILSLLDGLRREGMGILMITHDLSTAAHFADRIAVMYLGRIVEEGPAQEVVRNPQHPYTRALISVVPKRDPNEQTVPQILTGETPNPVHVPSGCRFHPRCPVAEEACRTIDPSLQRPNGANVPEHRAACIVTAPGPSADEVGPDGRSAGQLAAAAIRPASLELSGWWRRAWALVIDVAVMLAGGVALGGILALVPGSLGSSLRVGIGVVLFSALYFTIAHGSTGQTLGKRALGIAVRDVHGSGPIGYPRAFLRWLAFAVFTLLTVVVIVDLLFPLWDDRRQALHDKVASSSVFQV